VKCYESMTPEEISFLENFVYPGILLGIGALITMLLIPYINRIHEEKLKRIDRDREDYKFELQIKNEIFKKYTELESLNWTLFTEILEEEDKTKVDPMSIKYQDKAIPLKEELEDYITLYFENNKKLRDKLKQIFKGSFTCLAICSEPPNTKSREKFIKRFQEHMNIKLSDEEFKQSLETKLVFPKPVYIVHNLIRGMKLHIKQTKTSVN